VSAPGMALRGEGVVMFEEGLRCLIDGCCVDQTEALRRPLRSDNIPNAFKMLTSIQFHSVRFSSLAGTFDTILKAVFETSHLEVFCLVITLPSGGIL